jgi:hypothetical protein
MISKIISRAACLRELASNPNSFSNCPDLHGGVPDLPEDRICMKPALLGKSTSGPRAIGSAYALKFAYALGPAFVVSGLTRFRASDLDLSQSGVCPGDLFFKV